MGVQGAILNSIQGFNNLSQTPASGDATEALGDVLKKSLGLEMQTDPTKKEETESSKFSDLFGKNANPLQQMILLQSLSNPGGQLGLLGGAGIGLIANLLHNKIKGPGLEGTQYRDKQAVPQLDTGNQ